MHPRARQIAGMLGVTVVLGAATAAAVDVRGTLTIPPGFGAPAPGREGGPRTFYWEEWNGFLDPRPARFRPQRELAVVLLGEATAAPTTEVRISGGNLVPSTAVVKASTALRIVNTDACAHELYADGVQGFGPLQTAPGNAREVPIAAAGHWVIRDRLYGHVQGHLHAVPNLAAIGTVGRDGAYNFTGVAAGTYTLKVFFGAAEVASQQVEVPDRSELTIEPIALRVPAPAAAAPAAPAAPQAPTPPAPAGGAAPAR